MPSREINLAELVRAIVAATVPEATGRARTTRVLSGSVEDLSDDLDVIYVRADRETMGTSPTESDNYGSPGIIPATRIGEAFTAEQVRMDFNGAAGATAMRTDIPSRIVLPYGAEMGKRIVLDGRPDAGFIAVFDEQDRLVGFLDSTILAIGDLSTPGARATLDPIGGLRLRSATDQLVTIIDQQGYSLKDNETGAVTAEIKAGGFRLVDPTGTDDIQMTTSSAGSLPNPSYASAGEVIPGTSLTIPAASLFTTPNDDLEIGHVAAWVRNITQAATMTPPTGWTEHHDGNIADAAGTLQQSLAIRQPATGATADFTSSQGNWQHSISSHVVLRGGGPTSPSFRSMTTGQAITTDSQITDTLAKPAGVVAGDVLLAFICLGVNGGLVPSGWITPPGWSFLGANFSSSGSGASQSTVASGVWARLAGPSEPTEYSTTINLPTGTKVLQSALVAVQDAFLISGGVQIRLAGRPMRRLLASTELMADSATLCDFQNISQDYDHLELVLDTSSNTSADAVRRVRMRLNNDAGASAYHYRITENGTSLNPALNQDRIFIGIINGLGAGNQMWGTVNIYSYATLRFRSIAALTHAIEPGTIRVGDYRAVWRNTTDAVNRVTIAVDSGTTQFSTGDRAFLYGY